MAIDETVDVSAAAKAAIRQAVELLNPYDGDPRISALISKLTQIGNPVSKADKIAGELLKVAKAADELGPLGLEDRAGVAKATREAQLRYLREVSPAAAASLDREREREYDRVRGAA